MNEDVLILALADTDSAKPAAPKQDQTPVQPGSLDKGPPPPVLWSPFRTQLGNHPELVLLVAGIAACAILIFGWALIFRKPSSRTLASRRTGASSGHRRKRRRDSGENAPLPRNPTLKDRGGLPPMRPDGDPQPPQSPG